MDRFHASLYPCPDTQKERRQVALGVMTRIEDLQTVIDARLLVDFILQLFKRTL